MIPIISDCLYFPFFISYKDDYEAMLKYFMKLKILSLIMPVFAIVFAIAILIMTSSGLGGGIVIILDILFLALSIYGSYRLFKSFIYSLHLAVKRDGVCFVQDDHIEGGDFLAAFHVFDSCLFVSKRSQTVSREYVMGFFEY